MQAQTRAEEDAEEEEVGEPGEEVGKDEADGQAEQEGPALSAAPAAEEEAVKTDGGASEQVKCCLFVLFQRLRRSYCSVGFKWLVDVG